MKKTIMAIILIAICTTCHSQSLNIGAGATNRGHGNFHAGFDFNLFDNSVRVTPEFISMVPHTELYTLFGAKAGVVIARRFAIQGGGYYALYSMDRTEYTAGRNHWTMAGFASYDVYVYQDVGSITLSAGYFFDTYELEHSVVHIQSKVDEWQAMITFKINIGGKKEDSPFDKTR